MKHFAPYALVWLLCTVSVKGFSQGLTTPKPKIFANSPTAFICQQTDFTSIFAAQQGQDVTLSFSGNFSFSGTVVANSIKYNGNLQTVTIRSSTLDNTLLNISKRIDADKSSNYVGRIINMKYFDGYELQRDATGTYQFTKIETDKVVQSCHQ